MSNQTTENDYEIAKLFPEEAPVVTEMLPSPPSSEPKDTNPKTENLLQRMKNQAQKITVQKRVMSMYSVIFLGQLILHITLISTKFNSVSDIPESFIYFLIVWTFVIILLAQIYFVKQLIFSGDAGVVLMNIFGTFALVFSIVPNCILIYIRLSKQTDFLTKSPPGILHLWHIIMIPFLILNFIVISYLYRVHQNELKNGQKVLEMQREHLKIGEFISTQIKSLKTSKVREDVLTKCTDLSTSVETKAKKLSTTLTTGSVYSKFFMYLWIFFGIGVIVSAGIMDKFPREGLIALIVFISMFIINSLAYFSYPKILDVYITKRAKIGSMEINANNKIVDCSNTNLKNSTVQIFNDSVGLTYIRVISLNPDDKNDDGDINDDGQTRLFYTLPLVDNSLIYRAFEEKENILDINTIKLFKGCLLKEKTQQDQEIIKFESQGKDVYYTSKGDRNYKKMDNLPEMKDMTETVYYFAIPNNKKPGNDEINILFQFEDGELSMQKFTQTYVNNCPVDLSLDSTKYIENIKSAVLCNDDVIMKNYKALFSSDQFQEYVKSQYNIPNIKIIISEKSPNGIKQLLDLKLVKLFQKDTETILTLLQSRPKIKFEATKIISKTNDVLKQVNITSLAFIMEIRWKFLISVCAIFKILVLSLPPK